MTRSINRATAFAMALALSAGLFVAALVPKSAQATPTTYYLDLHPTANFLTCGWHDGACWDYPTPVASGWALDWATSPAGAFNAYFYTKSSNGLGYSNAGTGTVSYVADYCQNYTYVVIKDPGGNWHADALYVHTEATTHGISFTISSGTYPQTTSYELGETASEDGCAWTGYHVHEQTGGGFTTRLTSNYPDEDNCNYPNNSAQCGIKDIDTYAMLSTSWTY